MEAETTVRRVLPWLGSFSVRPICAQLLVATLDEHGKPNQRQADAERDDSNPCRCRRQKQRKDEPIEGHKDETDRASQEANLTEELSIAEAATVHWEA